VIVYGDPQREETLDLLWSRLWVSLTRVLDAGSSGEWSLDALRTLLIQAGELEQAAMDGPPGLEGPAAARLQEVTDHAAEAFYARWAPAGGAPPGRTSARDALIRMARSLNGFRPPGNARVTVKLPEGFAFYALYPEQYCLASLRWLSDDTAPGPVVVVGIRSIGTTLSAVVTAALRAAGRDAYRLTVRPSGHPFTRQVEITVPTPPELGGPEGAWGLVVDEGPGLSGSSMAAAGAALVRAGLDRSRIRFFPGHEGEPGDAASEEVRSWWVDTPRYVTPLCELRWEGRSLPEALAALTPDLLRSREPVEQVQDLGGGQWRSVVFRDPGQWPAVCAAFELPKYRCTMRDGASVLWKFAGLGPAPGGAQSATQRTIARLRRLADEGWTPAPLGSAFGFVAAPWVEGAPLTRADADPAVLSHVGRYLVRAAGPPLAPREGDAALARLGEMLYWNTWESLGEEAAARTRHWSEKVAALQPDASPSYGDGHLAPHEWLRTPSGQLLKGDCAGHETDHTIVGRQPLAWDIVGAMVEWGLDEAGARPLLEVLECDSLLSRAAVPRRQQAVALHTIDVLTFYRMAYAAFRVGQCTLCAGMNAPDPEEPPRLGRAAAFYRDQLARLLEIEP
jgi:hypothetical protein